MCDPNQHRNAGEREKKDAVRGEPNIFEYILYIPMNILKARTHRNEYRSALFASVFQCVFCVHTQAIFADHEPSEHANSFPDIRWHLM